MRSFWSWALLFWSLADFKWPWAKRPPAREEGVERFFVGNVPVTMLEDDCGGG